MPRALLVVCMAMWVIGAMRISTAFADPHVVASKQVLYLGVHPVRASDGGGFCNIEGPHVHVYRPEHADELYRVIHGGYLFIGDPVPFGYDGPKHAYYGRHPIPVDEILAGDHSEHDGAVFCYLDGPHYHIYAPPPRLTFVLRGGAYWYIGDWPRSYQIDGPRYQKINAVYALLVYERPVVTATAPAGYHVPVVKIEVPRRAHVVVNAPPVLQVRARPWLVIDDDDDDDDIVYYQRHPHRHRHHEAAVIEVVP